jgi:molybdopterin-guanine dinucleotide biosynthesis protein A
MGRPKAWLPFGGETLLQRTVRVLREVVEPVIVVAAPGQDVPLLPEEVRIVRDEVEGQGPLGGLAAGLAALEGAVDAAYLSACDVPFLKAAFVRGVIELLQKPNPPTPFPAREGGEREEPNPPTPFPAREGGAESFSPPALGEGPGEGFFKVAVPRVGEFLHPLAAVYRMITAERLRMQNLFDEVPTRIIEAHELADIDPDFRSLRNVNTPENYEQALRELERAGG